MAKDPDYVKLSRIDDVYTKNYTSYDELRSDIAQINSSILNSEANISLDNEYDSYSTAAREVDKLYGKKRNFSKKFVYGVVVGNSADPGKNVYVDVPLHNIDIVQDDSIFTKNEVDLKLYQELIFYPLMGLLQLTPQQGAICIVEIPDNYPEHISYNSEDAVFIELYKKDIVVPLDIARPEPIVIPGSLEEKLRNLESRIISNPIGGTAIGGGTSEFIPGIGIRPGALDLCGDLRIDVSKGASVNPKGSNRMLNCIKDSEFIKVVNEIANKYGIPPALVLALFYNESAATMSPSICNDLGYCGLFQLGKSGRRQFGISRENFTSMSISDQVKFFRDRYLPFWFPNWENASYAKNNPLSIGNFYAAVFLPAGRFFSENDVLTSIHPDRLKHSWQKTSHYTHNKGLDYDGDGSITIKDLENHLIKVANDIHLVGGGDGRGKSGCPEREIGVS